MLVFKVFPGIGDISWVYSKCVELSRTRQIAFSICNDWPPRASEFVDLLPRITNLGYGDFAASNGFGAPIPAETDLSRLPDGVFPVTVNPYLESGMRLSEIFPCQGTEYHYPLVVSQGDQDVATKTIKQAATRPRIGFYASSYSHSPERGFWNYDEWGVFLGEIARLYPTVTFVALGAPYDDKTRDVLQVLQREGVPVVNGMGVNLGATIQVIRNLDYFFAFPSGLGILADVVQTPCMMWYFSGSADAFLNTYADPANVASGKHINVLFQKVPEALAFFKERGMPWLRHCT